jgi:adenylate kinase family enzyme
MHQENNRKPGRRICVVGTTGSGKTTTARAIAQRLKLPHIELDALFWDQDWTPVAEEVFQERIKTAVAMSGWVVDGNYSRTRPLIWPHADSVVYLDYPFWTVFSQLLWRTLQRSLRDEELWAGNRETLGKAFLSRDSILVWMLRTYRRRRRDYPKIFAQPEYAHLDIIQLKSPRQTEAWLATLGMIDGG